MEMKAQFVHLALPVRSWLHAHALHQLLLLLAWAAEDEPNPLRETVEPLPLDELLATWVLPMERLPAWRPL
jgi:hypothetical protein